VSAPAEGEVLIKWEGLWKAFGPKRIFEGLDLEIRRGETLTIIGGSGSGKSVMLKCLIGLLYPDRGHIWFEGGDVTTYGEKEIREVRKRVAMVFQGAALFDSLTVGENIAYPLREHMRELSEADITARVAKNLKMVNLPGIEQMRPSDLSGGMRKRVGLARAIAIEPEVILYDEPTTGLDPVTGQAIARLIRDLDQRLGVTSVVVTHDIPLVTAVAERVVFLHEGRFIFSGTTEAARRESPQLVREFFAAGGSHA
jgi:phospholipid/cholesterol/gamma-HCH transport system ATP-binding protein